MEEPDKQPGVGNYDRGGTEPSDPRAGLKNQENNPQTTETPAGDRGTQSSREQLQNTEDHGGHAASTGPAASFWRPSKGEAKSRFGINKKGAVFGAIIAVLLIGLPAALLLFFGAYKLHDLTEHLEKRLVRASRQFNQNADKVLADKADIDAGDAAGAKLASESSLGKALDLIKPDRVVSRMQSQGVLDFQYTKGKLTAVVIDGEAIDAPKLKLGGFFRSSNRQAQADFQNQILTKTDELLRDSTSYQIRSRVGKAILTKAGAPLRWWQSRDSEANDTPQQAEEAEQLKVFKDVDNPSGGAVTGGIDKTADQAYQKELECLENTACATDVMSGNAQLIDISGAGKLIDDFISNLSTQQLFGYFNTLYAVLLPACMIYDGTVEASQAIVDVQNSAAIRAYLAITSADSQSVAGDVNGRAVGAFNSLLGDINNTNPEKMASGEPIDTSGDPSSAATRGQLYTPFGNIISPALVSFFTKIKGLCKEVTNIKAIALTTVIQLVLAPEFDAESEGIQAGIKSYMNEVLNGVWGRILALKEKSTALDFALKNGAIIGGTIGITYLARMMILSEMGAMMSTSQGDFVNTADQGGVVLNDELSRQQDYGRPMTAQETANSDVADATYLNHLNGNQSIYQRYFALSNPDSFLSTEAMALSGAISQPHQIVDAFMNVPRELLSGFKAFSGVIFGHALAASATTTDTTHYNQVEWGWTSAENNLINSDPSYDPLENARILQDNSKAEAAITQKYGPCYSDDIGTLLSSKPSGSNNFYITRDENGNVTNKGLCSPANLGVNSQDPLAEDPGSKQPDDMIFRWRLNQSYMSAVTELNDIQNTPAETSSP